MAILLVLLVLSFVVAFALAVPAAYHAGLRRGRHEIDVEQQRDLLDRAERYALTDKTQERAYAETLLALLGSRRDDPRSGLPTRSYWG